MEEVELLFTGNDSLLACCRCSRLIHEAVQLKCLHNCCRQCFSTAASTVNSLGVNCISCGAITPAGSEQPNGFIDGHVQRYREIAASRRCGVCECNGEDDKPALFWCPTCRHSLCGDCIAGHRQYFRQHVTKLLEELSSLDEVCLQSRASACATHAKPLEMACRNCEQAKCVTCSTECIDKKHEVCVVGNDLFDIYVGNVISSIASIENELLRKMKVLEKPKSLLRDMKMARDRHLEEIGMRKRCVVDAVEKIYQEIAFATKNAYDDLEAEHDSVAAAADQIDAKVSDTRNYIRRLVESDDKCVILIQQKIVRERLSALSTEVDSLSEHLTMTMREVTVEASLPDDIEEVVRAWIGMPRFNTASSSSACSPSQIYMQQRTQWQRPASSCTPASSQQEQSFSFLAASTSFKLPVGCGDVALTQDGRRLLLTACQYGLIELSAASGRELSRWWPPKHSSGQDDEVRAVAPLSDRRAAVSLEYARLVVLLRRSEKNRGRSSTSGAAAAEAAAAGDDAWTEECHLQLLCLVPWLSAHGDVLAASSGQRLQLLNLSSVQRLNASELQRENYKSVRKREYLIGSLSVAARVVVTGSRNKVELGPGRRAAHVLDAHSLDAVDGSDKRLWRHVLSSSNCSDSCQQEGEGEEELHGICADSTGGCLYAAVCRSDSSSGRVSALSLADGRELRRVAHGFYSAVQAVPQLQLLLPVVLSLCDCGAAKQQGSGSSSDRRDGRALRLAVLCRDPATGEQMTVTLHRSTSAVLQ